VSVAETTVVPALETAPKRFEPVAGPLHTVGMLLIIAGVAYLGYRSLHQVRATAQLNHLFLYSTSIIWGWAALGYRIGRIT
jgi:hypothetical protein